MKRSGNDEALRCSFCNKSQDAVGKLIASPGDQPRTYICNECVAVCSTILDEEKGEQLSAAQVKLPKPAEVKDFLDQYVI